MNLKEELMKRLMEIKNAPDSDDVCSIIKNTLEELIDDNITGLELQLSILFMLQELHKMTLEAKDYIEINNLKRGIGYVEQIGHTLGVHSFNYKLN